MSEDKNPREYWLLQDVCGYDGDAFIYESLDEFPPDGDESLLVHVREVIDETKQADTSTQKYEFTGETKDIHNCTVRQIRRISDGEVGGWIESEKNLSHEGDCWVYGDALVSGDAWVYGNAKVSGNAHVFGDAHVYGNAHVFGDAKVCGNAQVHGNAHVRGNAKVSSNAQVYGDAKVFGGLIR